MTDRKSTSFVRFTTCNVCRMSHNCGSKHIYTSRHQNSLKTVLKKSLRKVAEGKKRMESAEVHDEDWEKDSKFWCYFCSGEYPKHCTNNNLMIGCLGLIHHFTEHEHYESVKKFLKENRVSTDKAEKYIIKKTCLLSFISLLPEAEAIYLKQMDTIHQKHLSQLCEVEQQRKILLQQVANETVHNEANLVNGHNAVSNNCQPVVRISRHRKDFNQSDRHKIPPWFLPSDAVSCSASTTRTLSASAPIIGPSIKDLLEHVKKQQKKHLNSKRVGANFNHNASTSASWLPSFGRVWNQGRRKQSQVQYRNQKKKQQNL